MSFAIVYKVSNLVNGKVYIGVTEKELEKRKSEHINNISRFPNYNFYKAILKFGTDNFKWEIIDQANNMAEKYEKEIYWINYYRSFYGFIDCNGYNMTLGGGGRLGVKGEFSKNFGEKRSNETKLKLSNQKIGEKNPQFGRVDNLSPTFKDKIVSVDPYTKDIVVYESTMDIQRKLGVSNSGVVQCLNDKKVFMYGMFWVRNENYLLMLRNNTFESWIEDKRSSMTYGKPFIGFNSREVLYFNKLKDVKDYNMQPSSVNKCLRNVPKYKTHKGYSWKYISWDDYGEYLKLL